jgi:hypothetical protein
LKMIGWLQEVSVRIVLLEEAARFDPHGLAFWNLNTPEEFRRAEERARTGSQAGGGVAIF